MLLLILLLLAGIVLGLTINPWFWILLIVAVVLYLTQEYRAYPRRWYW